jgi:hypothetical protein
MDYRLYFIGHGGLCASVKELRFHDDEDAVKGVTRHVDGRAMELWHKDRYVRSFSAHPAIINPSDAGASSASCPRPQFDVRSSESTAGAF